MDLPVILCMPLICIKGQHFDCGLCDFWNWFCKTFINVNVLFYYMTEQEESLSSPEPINEPAIKTPKILATAEMVIEWKKWFANQGMSINSQTTYYSFLKKFIGFEKDITQKNIDRFLETNAGNVSNAALKSFIKFLVVKKEFPETLYLIRFERFKRTKKMPESISYQEVCLIIDNMPSVKTKILTKIIYELALRVSEALKLKWEDFNWFEWLQDKTKWGKVNLKDTKGGKFGVLSVKPELMNLLYNAHPQRTEQGIPIGNLLFEIGDVMEYVNNKDQPREYNLFHYIDNAKRFYRGKLNKTSKKVINKKVSPHMLRHSKAQHLLDSGMPIESLKEFLRHVDISTTEIYARASSKRVEADLKKYDPLSISGNNP